MQESDVEERERERECLGLVEGGKKNTMRFFLADLPHFYLVNLPSGSLSVSGFFFSQSVASLLCLIVIFCNF